MKKLLNLRLINSIKVVAMGLIAMNSFTANGQCTATNALTIPAPYLASGFIGDGNFNAIVFGNYNTGDGGTDGRLAVGGNFTLNSSLVGYRAGITGSSPAEEDNFIVNGLLTNTTGKDIAVRGNFYYGTLQNASPLPVHAAGQGTNINQTNRINFTDLKQHYVNLSSDYANLAASAAPDPIISDGNITLTGDNTVKNYVFNVSVSGNAITGVQFANIPVGSGILINILNSNITLSPTAGSMQDIHRPNTLFNFPNAVNILLNSFKVEGGVLAPQANLFVQTGDINGPAVIGGSITQSTGFSFNSACLSYPLPVKLVGFSANKEGEIANLTWTTATEKNAGKFTIQRLKEKKWLLIGEVLAKGESSEDLTYYFSDKSPLNGENLYRLKMSDVDGTAVYSSIVSLHFDLKPQVVVFPNPVAERISFENINWKSISKIRIVSNKGEVVTFQLTPEKTIEVKNWKPGLYLIHITANDGKMHTRKVIKY